MNPTDPCWLQFPANDNAAKLEHVGVLIACPSGPNAHPEELQWHTGLLYLVDDRIRLLHLEDHVSLAVGELPLSMSWACVPLSLEADLAEPMVALCDRIARLLTRNEGPRIPYGLRYHETIFSMNGEMQPGPQEHGLTCATFVLAMIRTFHPTFLDLESWPQREADAAWQRRVLTYLQRYKPDADLPRVEAEIGSRRYRPTEVAGAASHDKFPVVFSDAERAAQEIHHAFTRRVAQ